MENRLVVARGVRSGGGMDWGSAVGGCKPLHMERMDKHVLLFIAHGTIVNSWDKP